MTAQLDLEFRSPKKKEPVITPDEIALVIAQLRGKGWQTSTQLGATNWSQKRKLRAIVQAAGAAILSFPGSPGYKLFNEATLPEIDRSIALKAEARELLRKYYAYQRRRHQRFEAAA